MNGKMKKILFVTSILFFLLFLPMVDATRVESIEYAGSFIESMGKGETEEVNFNFDPPTGVDDIYSVRAEVIVDPEESPNISLEVNGQSCSPSSITIPKVARYNTYFDCSEALKQGNNTIKLSTTDTINNVNFNWKVIYQTSRWEDIELFGTEYNVDEDKGKAWLELTRDNQPVNNASCWLYSYYPNMTSWYNGSMMSHKGPYGIYYHDLDLPGESGVYPTTARCRVPKTGFSDEFRDYSKISPHINTRLEDGSVRLSHNAYPLPSWAPHTKYTHNESLLMYMSEDRLRGGEVIDESKYHNDGKAVGDIEYGVEGLVGDAFAFDGGDYINISSSPSLNITDEITVEGILKVSDEAGLSYTIASKWDDDGEKSWKIQPDSDISLWLDGSEVKMKPDANLRGVGYRYFAFTYNGSLMRFYIGEEIVAEKEATGQIDVSNAPVQIGTQDPDSPSTDFYGVIDYLMITPHGLNQSEIKRHADWAYGNLGAFSGYIVSEEIELEGENWETFNVDDRLYEGSYTYYDIINWTEPVVHLDEAEYLCNFSSASEHDISECVGNTSSIKIIGYLEKGEGKLSPEIERWSIEWSQDEIRQMTGSGQVHIKPSVSDRDKEFLLSNITSQFKESNETSWTIYENINGTMYEIKYQMLDNTTTEIKESEERLNASIQNTTIYLNTSLEEMEKRILQNTTTEIESAKENITLTIRDAEGNILTRINNAESNLNTTIYNTKDEILHNTTTEIQGTQDNLTLTIHDAEDNIVYQVNQSKSEILSNLTTRIDEAETNILNHITNAKNEIVDTLNTTLYNVRDYLYDAIIDARNFVVTNTTTEIQDSEDRLKINLTEEIEKAKEEVKENLTIEITQTEGNIVDRIGEAQNNITTELLKTEDRLNISLYEVKDQIEEGLENVSYDVRVSLNESEQRIKENTTLEVEVAKEEVNQSISDTKDTILYEISLIEDNLNTSLEETEDVIVTELDYLRNDIYMEFDNLNTSLYDVKYQIMDNQTLEIEEIEDNITFVVRDAEGNILNELNSTQEDLEDFLGENVTANVTAKCNAREVWKYFYTHPLRTKEMLDIFEG